MKTRFFLAALLLGSACSSQAAVVYGSNVIVNGDAESGVAGWTAYDPSYSMFQSVNYGSNWVLPSQPGPVDRGSSMFAGLGQYAVGFQTLDFGSALTAKTFFSLSGWLGGWSGQGDNALFYAQFLDGSNNELGTSAIGPVTPQDRNNQTGLFYREADGYVPLGTTKVSFWLSMERQVSADNDGYADNLSFVMQGPSVSPVPEPETASMLLIGLGLLGWIGRRKPKSRERGRIA